MATQQRLDLLVELGELDVRGIERDGPTSDSDALVAAVTGSPDRPGRSPAHSATRAVTGDALEATMELLRSGEAEMAHLDDGLDPGLAGGALGDDEDPDGLDRTVLGLGRSAGPTTDGGPGGLDGIEGIGLSLVAAGLAVRTVDLDDLDTLAP